MKKNILIIPDKMQLIFSDNMMYISGTPTIVLSRFSNGIAAALLRNEFVELFLGKRKTLAFGLNNQYKAIVRLTKRETFDVISMEIHRYDTDHIPVISVDSIISNAVDVHQLPKSFFELLKALFSTEGDMLPVFQVTPEAYAD